MRITFKFFIGLTFFSILSVIFFRNELTSKDGVQQISKQTTKTIQSQYLTNIGTNTQTERTNVGTYSHIELLKTKLILIYTAFFQRRPWFNARVFRNHTASCGCNFEKCELTYDRKRFKESALVVFHGRDMPSLNELNQLHKKRRKDQLWLYFIMENPLKSAKVKPLDRFFNWSSSYRLNADIRYPYRRHSRLNEEITIPYINYAKGKTKQVAWFVSKCGRLRDQLAKKLLKHGVQIEVSGRCENKWPHQINCDGNRPCKNELKKFKFYFAAENTFCKDYITEKYWITPIALNLIPIVLGGSNYSDSRLAIPGSFIDATSFKNAKALADYIKELDSNDEKYNEYFKWKTKWRIHDLVPGCYGFMCDVCDKLHSGYHLTKGRPLSKQINRNECIEKEEYFKEWITN